MPQYFRRWAVAAWILGLLLAGGRVAADPPTGDWVGGATFADTSLALSATLSNDAGSPRGEASVDTSARAPLRDLVLSGRRIQGTAMSSGPSLSFEGTIGDRVIRGGCRRGSKRGTFELFRVAVPDSAASRALEGVYRLPGGDLVSVSSGGGRPGAIYFDEGESDRSGELIPLSATEFVSGPAHELCYPFEIRARFELDARGVSRALEWQASGRNARRAMRVALEQEEVAYPSDDVTLSATLVKPTGPGPWPAIVFITGSGPATRDQFGGLPRRLAALGVAGLLYDKRGCGASTGRFHEFLPIDRLARDAQAGIAFLKGRADIVGTRIGLVAASQGGWLAPLVASRAGASFIVLQSAPMQNVAENDLFEIDHDLRFAGFSEDDVRRAHGLNQLFVRMVASGGTKGWDSLRIALEEAEHEPWLGEARLQSRLPATPAAGNLRWVERVRDYIAFDPEPLWNSTRTPVLAFHGGFDRNLPGLLCAELLRRRLSKAGNPDFEVLYEPNGDHVLWSVGSMRPTELHRERIKGLNRRREDWITSHAGLSGPTR